MSLPSVLLITEDELLEAQGAQNLEGMVALHAASSQAQMLEHLRQGFPDAILLDQAIHHLDSFALLRLLKAKFGTIPIMVVGSDRQSDLVVKALEDGAAIVRKEIQG